MEDRLPLKLKLLAPLSVGMSAAILATLMGAAVHGGVFVIEHNRALLGAEIAFLAAIFIYSVWATWKLQ